MILRIFILGLGLFCLTGQTIAQDTWSLEQCIDYAWQNSPQVRQNEISQEQAAITVKQAKWSQIPTINGSLRYGVNVGRSIDLTSYQFINEAFQSTSLSLNVNAPLYQGSRIRNTIHQATLDQEAAHQDLLQIQNDLALSTAQAYLTVLLAEENVEVLKEQAELTKAQYEQTLKLIDAGVVPDNNRFDLEAQMAMDEENILLAENNIVLAYLNLKTVMNLDISEEIVLEKMEPTIPENVDVLTLEEVYEDALTRQPSITAARIREESAQYGVKIAKGALTPSISAYANLSTNYSSLGRKVIGVDTVDQPIIFDFGGTPVTVDFPVSMPIYQNPYGIFPQLGDNLSQGIGININVPILNGWQTRGAIARAELGVESAKLNTTLLETQLKADVQRALLDAQAAKKRLDAAEKSAVSVRASVDNTRKRYELGVVNAFELTSVQNRLVSVESNVIQAKYDYIFKLKVLDFYRGQALTE